MRRLPASRKAAAIHRLINDTTVAYPDNHSITELFEACVRRYPDAIALIHRDRSVRYRELNQATNSLARQLAADGVSAGDIVGVGVERSPELIVALLAVLKCGAAYLPFDRSWPDVRLQAMLATGRCVVAVTDDPQDLERRLTGTRVVSADGRYQAGDANPPLAAGPDDIAYVNFTSGSTGRPKGVPIRHRSVARLVFHPRYANLDRHTRLIHLAAVSFDAATFEIWGALLHGGICVLYPSSRLRLSELARLLEVHRVNVVFLTTALFNTIVDEAPDMLDHVGTILTGGETHSLSHIRTALHRYGPHRLVSVYGPTECTTFATYHRIREVPADLPALPIGQPIQNTRLYLVNNGRLCAPGETGEVWLAGPGLSPGYLDDDATTAERFVEYDVDGTTQRLYRTGDRGYQLASGDVVFGGRVDDQVKVNGFRIELGELTHHLDQIPHVKQSYVTVSDEATGDRRLLAFVVLRDSGCTAQHIREHLRRCLPGYMLPNTIHLCDALPLSTTGKVDREALLATHRPRG